MPGASEASRRITICPHEVSIVARYVAFGSIVIFGALGYWACAAVASAGAFAPHATFDGAAVGVTWVAGRSDWRSEPESRSSPARSRRCA